MNKIEKNLIGSAVLAGVISLTGCKSSPVTAVEKPPIVSTVTSPTPEKINTPSLTLEATKEPVEPVVTETPVLKETIYQVGSVDLADLESMDLGGDAEGNETTDMVIAWNNIWRSGDTVDPMESEVEAMYQNLTGEKERLELLITMGEIEDHEGIYGFEESYVGVDFTLARFAIGSDESITVVGKSENDGKSRYLVAMSRMVEGRKEMSWQTFEEDEFVKTISAIEGVEFSQDSLVYTTDTEKVSWGINRLSDEVVTLLEEGETGEVNVDDYIGVDQPDLGIMERHFEDTGEVAIPLPVDPKFVDSVEFLSYYEGSRYDRKDENGVLGFLAVDLQPGAVVVAPFDGEMSWRLTEISNEAFLKEEGFGEMYVGWENYMFSFRTVLPSGLMVEFHFYPGEVEVLLPESTINDTVKPYRPVLAGTQLFRYIGSTGKEVSPQVVDWYRNYSREENGFVQRDIHSGLLIECEEVTLGDGTSSSYYGSVDILENEQGNKIYTLPSSATFGDR